MCTYNWCWSYEHWKNWLKTYMFRAWALKKKMIEDIHVSCPWGLYDIVWGTGFSLNKQFQNYDNPDIFLKEVKKLKICELNSSFGVLVLNEWCCLPLFSVGKLTLNCKFRTKVVVVSWGSSRRWMLNWAWMKDHGGREKW